MKLLPSVAATAWLQGAGYMTYHGSRTNGQSQTLMTRHDVQQVGLAENLRKISQECKDANL